MPWHRWAPTGRSRTSRPRPGWWCSSSRSTAPFPTAATRSTTTRGSRSGIAAGIFITAIHHMGLATLTHTPSPMGFLTTILERPRSERPFVLFPVGYPADDATVPDLRRKSLAEVAVFDPPWPTPRGRVASPRSPVNGAEVHPGPRFMPRVPPSAAGRVMAAESPDRSRGASCRGRHRQPAVAHPSRVATGPWLWPIHGSRRLIGQRQSDVSLQRMGMRTQDGWLMPIVTENGSGRGECFARQCGGGKRVGAECGACGASASGTARGAAAERECGVRRSAIGDWLFRGRPKQADPRPTRRWRSLPRAHDRAPRCAGRPRRRLPRAPCAGGPSPSRRWPPRRCRPAR